MLPGGLAARAICAAGLGALATMSTASAADVPVAPPKEVWTVTFATEVRYYSWKSDRGTPTTQNNQPGAGSQVYIPYAMQIVGKPLDDIKLTVLVRSGWVHSHQTTAGLTGTVDTILDTVGAGTLTYYGFQGVQPFVGLSVNAPTGRSALFGSAANARMDPDLVEIGSFGEGWNIGPTAGLNFPITSALMITTSVGYTWRGAFDRERSSSEVDPTKQTPTSTNPGDVVTGTAAIGYQNGPWALSATGTISEETTTVENGADLYRAGRRYVGTGTVSYTWPEKWGQTTVTGSYAHSNRNQVKFLAVPVLLTEIFNTNSDVYRIAVQHLFPLGDSFAWGPTGSYLHRNHNSYDSTTFQFVPAKDRWAAGGQIRYAAGPNVTFNARAEHVWVEEGARPALPDGTQFSVLANGFVTALTAPQVSSTGWMLSGGANVKF
jgi:hypothetical protein